MSDLRSRIVRLAHADPSLRSALLPLLVGREASADHHHHLVTQRIIVTELEELGVEPGSVRQGGSPREGVLTFEFELAGHDQSLATLSRRLRPVLSNLGVKHSSLGEHGGRYVLTVRPRVAEMTVSVTLPVEAYNELEMLGRERGWYVDRPRGSRLASGVPLSEDVLDDLRPLVRVWSSVGEAESALHRVLGRHGLRLSYVANGPRGDWQRWYLEAEDGGRVSEPLNVLYHPGPRPGWVKFQVSA